MAQPKLSYYIRVPVQVPATVPSILFSANVSGKAEDGPGTRSWLPRQEARMKFVALV